MTDGDSPPAQSRNMERSLQQHGGNGLFRLPLQSEITLPFKNTVLSLSLSPLSQDGSSPEISRREKKPHHLRSETEHHRIMYCLKIPPKKTPPSSEHRRPSSECPVFQRNNTAPLASGGSTERLGGREGWDCPSRRTARAAFASAHRWPFGGPQGGGWWEVSPGHMGG